MGLLAGSFGLRAAVGGRIKQIDGGTFDPGQVLDPPSRQELEPTGRMSPVAV